jgi:hypothetical protein
VASLRLREEAAARCRNCPRQNHPERAVKRSCAHATPPSDADSRWAQPRPVKLHHASHTVADLVGAHAAGLGGREERPHPRVVVVHLRAAGVSRRRRGEREKGRRASAGWGVGEGVGFGRLTVSYIEVPLS